MTMPRLHSWLLAGALTAAAAHGVQPTVELVAIPANLPDGATVYVTGNNDQLGNWNPSAVPMEKQADGSWRKSLSYPIGTQLEFKFTLGRWGAEAVNAQGVAPSNYYLNVMTDLRSTYDIAGWKQGPELPAVRITGTLVHYTNMPAAGLAARDVLVWLPPSYASEPERRYPVLYMHDGQQVFDPATSTHGVDWGVDETATRLIAEGKMREIIVVAPYCTSNRFQEYGFTKTGPLYQRYIVAELKPFIDRTYRTLPGREHTAVMGASMGGCVSFLLAWNHPDVFFAAGCLSPAFDPPMLDWVAAYDSAPKGLKIYMDNGGVGLEEELQAGCDGMLKILPGKGFVPGTDLVWFKDPQAEHNEAAWALRVEQPLRMMFGTEAR